MLTDQVRTTIVNALDDANAIEHLRPALLMAFEGGQEDIPLADLGLDSLKRMELMVALEMEHDAVIAPRQFMQFSSLGDIVAHIESSTPASAAQAVDPVTGAERGLERDQDSLAAPLGSDLEPSVVQAGAQSAESEAKCATYRSDDVPGVVRLLQRAFCGCRTVAHLNKALVSLESRITPLEYAALAEWHQRKELLPEETPQKYATALSEWLDQLAQQMQQSGKTEPEPFKSVRVAPAVVHFIGPGERARKTLLICFAISGGRYLFIPNSVLLQHVDASKYDLLILSDPWDTAFRAGVPLMGDNVTDVVEWVAGLDLLSEYGGLRVLGCSAGGYPAMLVGREVGAELAVSIAGRIPHKRYLGQITKMVFNSWRSYHRNKSARALIVYCERKRRDKAFARLIALVTGANRLTIQMPARQLGHDLLGPLLKNGELSYFLEHTLLAPLGASLVARKRMKFTMQFPVA